MPPPITNPALLALRGRIVCMDAAGRVLPDGIVYLRGKLIAGVAAAAAPPPAEFTQVPVIKTEGTIYPGLIELHNHLSYNALPLWKVPKKYTNRNQWSGPSTPAYHQLVTGPMSVLGRLPKYVNAIVRFVECRCLLGGVTTSQGVALSSNAGIMRHYRGLVRNVEAPGDLNVRAAGSHIADVDGKDSASFLARLQNASCLLLHLSEGTDQAAREHFEALRLPDGSWAITPALVGIHAVALKPEDFAVLQGHGGSMVWSPLSNLLLYGDTADIAAAKASGIKIGLGSDWAPSGSKNLLGEMKIARLVSAARNGVFTDQEIVAMATCAAARILNWESVIGSIEVGKRADLIVVRGQQKDAYAQLIEAPETDLQLIVIDGVPRYGTADLMNAAAPATPTEQWQVGGAARLLALAEDSADADVGALTLRQAYDTMVDGLDRLPQLAHDLEHPAPHLLASTLVPDAAHWSLVLDHEDCCGVSQRPHLPWRGRFTAMPLTANLSLAAHGPLSQELVPGTLDPLTVADDTTFLDRLEGEGNLPAGLVKELRKLY